MMGAWCKIAAKIAGVLNVVGKVGCATGAGRATHVAGVVGLGIPLSADRRPTSLPITTSVSASVAVIATMTTAMTATTTTTTTTTTTMTTTITTMTAATTTTTIMITTTTMT